jgi:hypothetical protein
LISIPTNLVTNIHKFVRHKWKKNTPKKWKNLGTWRYVTTFKYCYPNTCEILIKEYGLTWQDKIIAYITKEITTPKFSRYRTRFRKVFCGTLREYQTYLTEFMRQTRKKN